MSQSESLRRQARGSPKPRLLYVVNIPRFFVSHRLPLALAARERGFDVHVCTSTQDATAAQRILDASLPLHPIPLSQHGLNPAAELRALLALRKLYARLKPDLLHHISIKPVLYGGIAARLTGQRRMIHAMSGLGYVFVSQDVKARLLRRLVGPVFRAVNAGQGARMLFQNPDDQTRFIDGGLVATDKTRLIRGSGVDESVFSPAPEPSDEPPVVLFAGRLLWQKGLGNFVEAARRLQDLARFRVVGYEEATSPLNVPASQLRAWQREGLIEWAGASDCMPKVYADAHIVCLPSTYGEGVPKTLIEAAACGRACVATDAPGCREIVRDGINGNLVPPGDIDALTAAVAALIDDPARRKAMGAAGRQIALEGFTLRQVIDETIALYHELLADESLSRG